MKKILIFVGVIIFMAGCAKVNLATKEPLKVDINMRVDVYQHVVKDVEDIEGQIYGSDNSQSKLDVFFWCESVYAADSVQAAIQARRARASHVEGYLSSGYAGENRQGYLEVLSQNVPSSQSGAVASVVAAENKDRRAIYEYTAQKNGAALSETEKIFFQNHYDRAPSGYWFQVYDQSKGGYAWVKK